MDNASPAGLRGQSNTEGPESEQASHHTSFTAPDTITVVAPPMSLTSGSDFFATSGGREMLDLMDSLRSIDKISNTIPLPQIIVVGQQSSGKSSVLNAISGIKFPVDQGLQTRFPTEIILKRTAHTQTTVSIHHTEKSTRPEAFNEFEAHWRREGVSLARLPEVIARATNILSFEGGTKYTDSTLVLEICSPEQENLTLIDLPGLITSSTDDQPTSDIEFVENIVEKHMANKRAIVLAVLTGRTDLQNQKLIQKLKDNPHYGDRSLGVVTGPDLIEPDSHLESEFLEHVNNRRLKLRHGWHVLRNLMGPEMREGLDRNSVENSFFETKMPWRAINKSQVGISALKKRLSELLQSSIANALPTIAAQIQSTLSVCVNEQKALGVERSTSQQQKKYLNDCGNMFKKIVIDALVGHPQFGKLGSAEMSLRARTRLMGQRFRDEMERTGRSWTLVPKRRGDDNGKNPDAFIEGVVMGKHNTTKELYEDDVLLWLSEQVWRNQGQEPPNLVNPRWAGQMFRYQTQKWKDLAQTHLNDVFDIVKQEIVEIVRIRSYRDVSGNVLRKLVLPAMKQLKVDLDAKLSELLKPYCAQYPQTLSKRYFEKLQTRTSEDDNVPASIPLAGDARYDNCRTILQTVDAYYDICSDVFIDNVQNLAVEHCLLDKLEALAGPETFISMDDRELDEIAGESSEVKQERARLKEDIEQYEKALNELIPSLELRALGQYDISERATTSNTYAAKLAEYFDDAKKGALAKPREHRSTEHRQSASNQASIRPTEHSNTSAASDDNASSDTLHPVSVQASSLATPQKNRRRTVLDRSPAQTSASGERDNLSTPSTAVSGPSERTTASSIFPFGNSPQPPTKE